MQGELETFIINQGPHIVSFVVWYSNKSRIKLNWNTKYKFQLIYLNIISLISQICQTSKKKDPKIAL